MRWGAFFYPHTVHLRALNGRGSLGESHASAEQVSAEVKDEQAIVRDGDGAEVVASTQVTVPLDTVAPLGSLVTVWPGTPDQREARVLRVRRDENAPPLDSFQVLYLE